MSIYRYIEEQHKTRLKNRLITLGIYVLTVVISLIVLNYFIHKMSKVDTPVVSYESDYETQQREEVVVIKSSSKDKYLQPDYESSKDLFIQAIVDVEKELERLRKLSLVNPFKDVGYQIEPISETTSNSNTLRYIEPSEYFNTLSDEDYQILLRIVQAEAGGIDYEETLWTAHAITNRVLSSRFPNTIYDVVFANNGKGAYQYSPIANGSYFKAIPNDTVIRAVNECINNIKSGVDPTGGALFFMVPSLSSERGRSWQENNTELIATIGTTQFRR